MFITLCSCVFLCYAHGHSLGDLFQDPSVLLNVSSFITLESTSYSSNNLVLDSLSTTLRGQSNTTIQSSLIVPALFDLRNSTFDISTVWLSQTGNESITILDACSTLSMQICALFINTPMSPSFVSRGGTLNLMDVSIRSSDHSSHNNAFLSSGPFSRFNLISSTFSNISTSLLKNCMDGVWSDDVTNSGVITSSNFDRCDGCYTGALYSNNRFRTLLTTNSSFSNFTLTNEVQQTLTATTSFIGDVFDSLSREGEGGAIQFKPSLASAVLTVTDCTFTTCTSTSSFKGGAAFASLGQVVISGTKFTECTGHSGGAIATANTQITVYNCGFFTCEALCLSWIEEKGDMSTFYGDPSTPPAQRLNGGGGAMWIELQSSYYLLSACLFESCLAPSFGGGMLFWNFDCTTPGFFRIVNCMFFDTTGLLATPKMGQSGGQNVMIACHRFTDTDYDGYNYFAREYNYVNGVQTRRLESIFTDTVETSAKNIQVGSSSHLTGPFVESSNADVYVATTGSDATHCGDKSSQCKTVTYAANKVTANYKVIVAAGEFSSSNGQEAFIRVLDKTIRIEGEGSLSTSVSFTKPTFYETSNMKVTTGTLSVTAMTLTLNTGSSDGWDLIEVDGTGSVKLTDCILEGTGSAQNGRLVTIIGGSFTATGCEFNNIQSTLSTGAAIHADLTSSSTFILSSSSFTNCKLGTEPENVGAGLFLHLQDNAKIYSLRWLTFAGGEANRAADIFISTPTLDEESQYLFSANFQMAWQNTETDNLRFKCLSRDSSYEPQEMGIPLYLASLPVLFVDSNSRDDEDCGSQDAPCQSLTFAASQMSLRGVTVIVMVSALLKGTTDITNSFIVPEHESDQAALQISDVSSLTNTGTTMVAIHRIDFVFGTPLSSSTPLLTTSTGSFVLQSCFFKSSGSVVTAQTLISISKPGTLTTDGLRIADISFSSPAVSIDSPSISVSDVTFSSCSFTSSAVTFTSPSISVGFVTFSDCLFSSSAVTLTSSKISVGEVTFSSCSFSSSAVTITSSSTSVGDLTLSSCSFTGTLPTTLVSISPSSTCTLLSVGKVSFTSFSTTSTPSSSSELTLASIRGPSTSTFTASTATPITYTEDSITSNAVISFSGSPSSSVPLLKLSLGSVFSATMSNTKVVFAGSTSASSAASLADTTSFSLSFSATKIDITNLYGSFTSSIFAVPANTLSISLSSLSSFLSHSTKYINVPFARVTGGTLSLSKVYISSSIFSSSYTSNVIVQTAGNVESGSAVSATLGSGASLSLASDAFSNCDSEMHGGALSITIASGSLSITKTTFTMCKSSLNGGAIVIDLISLSSPDSFSMSSVTFGTTTYYQNECGEGWKGSDMFIYVPSGQTSLISSAHLTDSSFNTPTGGPSSQFTSSDLTKYEYTEKDGSSGSILYLLNSYTGGQLFVHPETIADKTNCGSKYFACSTFTLGHSKSTDSPLGNDASVFLSTDVTLSAAFTSSKTVEWTSDPLSRKTITLTASSTFTVSSNHLSLSHLILTVSAASSSKSLFTVNGGSLSVSDCEFKSIATTVSGSAISATLGSDTSLSLASVFFTSCTAKGNGGALYVILSSGGTFSTSGTVTFEGCSATGNGQSLYLSNTNLATLLGTGCLDAMKPSLPPNNALFTASQKDQFFGYQSVGSSGSLLYYWYAPTDNTFRVSSAGDDDTRCGASGLPCKSLEFARNSLAVSGVVLILTSDLQLTTQIDVKFEAETIKCEESFEKTLTIKSTGSVTVGSSTQKDLTSALTFSTVSFLFDTTTRSSPFFRVSSGTLVFTACTFGISTAKTTLPNIVVLAEGGTLTMTASTIQNMSSSSPLLSLTGGQTTLATLDVKSIALTKTTLIALNNADLTVMSSTFNTITNTLGNGSILSATIPSGKTVTIEDGSATCCSTTGNGGAIFVRLIDDGRFEMKGTSGMSFSNCQSNTNPQSSPGTTGNGNCVFLGLDGGAVDFSFDKVRFPSTVSSADPSPFLFVESDDLEASITTDRFNFLQPFEFIAPDYEKYIGIATSSFTNRESLVTYLSSLSEAYLSTSGDDNMKCGSPITPCESLARALAVLIADSEDTEPIPHYHVVLMDNGIHNTTMDIEEFILSVATMDTLETQELIAAGSSFILGEQATEDTSLSLQNLKLKWIGPAGTFLDQSKGTVLLSACSIVNDDATTLFSSSVLIVKGGTLTLSDFTIDCTLKKTHPLLEISGGNARISDVQISNAQLASSLFTGNGDITIESSSFSSLVSSTSSIAFTLSTSSHKLHIGSPEKPVSFTLCKSEADGGALNVAITSGDLSITETTFKKCSSLQNGGAIFVDLILYSSPGSYSLASVTFGTADGDLNSCVEDGNDLFISVASGKTSLISLTHLTDSYFTTPSGGPSSVFTSSEMDKYHFSEISGSSGSLLYLLHPYTGGQLLLNSEFVSDDGLCGHMYLACKTLRHGHAMSKDSPLGNDASVFLSTDVTLSAAFSSSKTVEWTSDPLSRKTLTLTDDGSLTISSDILSLSHLILTMSAAPCLHSLFTVNGGSLIVSNCEFKSIASSSSGSAISATLESGTSLSLSTVTFTSCTSKGSGGALHVTVDGGSFSTSGTITFEDCSATGIGQLLFLSSPSLFGLGSLNSIKPSLPENNALFTETQKSHFFGLESGSSSGSLLYYWYPHTTSEIKTHIHSSGEDHPYCGLVSLPCQSISTALTHRNRLNSFSIDSALTLSQTITVDETKILKSSSSTAITVTSTGFIFVTSNTLTLSNLDFTGSGTSTVTSFVTVSSTGSLSVWSCSFTSFSSTTNGGALNIALTTGTLSIESTSFKKCSSSLNGGAIFVDVSGASSSPFTLSGASFGTAAGDLNSCGNFGMDVFIKAGDLSSFKDTSLFPPAYSAASINESLLDSIRLSSTHTKFYLSLLQYFYAPTTEGTLDDSKNSADTEQCGHLELSCKSLNTLNGNAPSLKTAKITNELTITDLFTPTKTLTITAATSRPANLLLRATPSLSFSTPSHTLTLSSLAITIPLPTTTANSEQPSIIVEKGTLVVDHSFFTSAKTLSSPLISVSGAASLTILEFDVNSAQLNDRSLNEAEGSGRISIKNTNFTSVRVTSEGIATALTATLSSFSSFALDTVHIDDCGTAVILDMNGCTPSTNYNVKAVTFEQTSEKQLMVTGENLYSFITSERWTGSYESLDDETKDVIYSYDEAWDLSTSLHAYLITHQGDVTVSTETGAESPICGSESVPCTTLELGLSRVSNAACICKSAVDLGSSSVLINKNVTVKGQSIESSSLVFRESQSIVCSFNTPTSSPAITITTITLHIIAASSNSEGFVVIQNGHVVIEKVQIACQSLHTPALFTSGGTPVLNELTFAVSSHTSDILVISCQTTFENTSISAITSGFFLMKNAQQTLLSSLTLTGSNPSSPSSSSEELCSWMGGVIQITSSEPTIKRSSFSSISSGVLSVIDSTVTLIECTFSKNVAGITPHPNLQRNILCKDSSISIDQNSVFVQNSESDPVSLWISEDQCSIELPSTIPKSSTFFVPTLPQTITSEAYEDVSIPSFNEARKVTITGSNFVSCGLSLVVVQSDKDVDDTSAIAFNLNGDVPRGITAFVATDSSISFVIDPKTSQMADGLYSLHVVLNKEAIGSYELMEVTIRKNSQVMSVGEKGSDEADGTFENPFETLHRCVEPSKAINVGGSESKCELVCSVSDKENELGMPLSSFPTAMISLTLQTLTFTGVVFSSFTGAKSFRFVFSLMSSSRLILTSCSLSSSTPLSVSLVSASSSSSFSAVALATSALSFVGKASLVVCSGQSRISLSSSTFSSTSFDAGAFVWGSTSGDVSVEDTDFVGCRGREFGSLIRVKMAGSTTTIKKCRFVSCSTVLSLSEKEGRRIVGGGCVLVEMVRRTQTTRLLPPSCADLSLSSFSDCSLINTNISKSLSSSSKFVGGSGFVIVGHENSDRVKLPKVTLSNCTCENFGGVGWFSGGAVVGEGQHVRTDRRGCVVEQCTLGSVILR
ncbi:hypothetical protein BLNAU_10543 [Blattamonas nauphoetae]|uniref:Uncharacterized protein n=1 Tax=Blattamonas nauphoetae TaxID=2049346 RepID=A0ABQ9XQ30_9EUKA|nr:hypothetical protein BLNAU_10543 [Blattamonas nauphoetae]